MGLLSNLTLVFLLAFSFSVSATESAQAGEITAAQEKAKPDIKSDEFADYLLSEHGLRMIKGYDRKRLAAMSKDDHLWPTGIMLAYEKGGDYKDLWEAELLIAEGKNKKAKLLIDKAAKNNPDLKRVLFLKAQNTFFIGEKLDREDGKGRLKTFDAGYNVAKRCIKLYKTYTPCLVLAGSLLGRISTTKGIISSASNGKYVEGYWKRANSSKINYRYPSGTQVKSVSRFVLGIFYRMVPDSFWLNLFFGVRGDINKSIKLSDAALKIDPLEQQFYADVGAAYFCKYQRDEHEPSLKAGKRILNKCLALPYMGKVGKMTRDDCKKLLGNPALGCGYSRDKQQETDAEKFKKKK